MLNRSVLYHLSDTVSIEVPIGQNQWDDTDLAEYEASLMAALAVRMARIPGSITMVDAGADIGLFSLKAYSLCSSIGRIVCFEPNAEAFPWLEKNLAQFSIPAEALAQALSDFRGTGELKRPEYDATDHGRYLEPASDGPIQVTTVDELSLPPAENLLIKLDIEGGELAALRGAARTIQSAASVLVVFEAHPRVAERTGMDPVECMRLLNGWRPFQFVIAEKPNANISMERPVFEQVGSDQVYNFLGESTAFGGQRPSGIGFAAAHY